MDTKHIATIEPNWGGACHSCRPFSRSSRRASCRARRRPSGTPGKSLPRAVPTGSSTTCEDGNNQTKVVGGRGGYWYTFTDEFGTTVVPEAGADGVALRHDARRSEWLEVRGQCAGPRRQSARSCFGAMGMNFVDPKGPYDASQYKGIAFWAKKGPGQLRQGPAQGARRQHRRATAACARSASTISARTSRCRSRGSISCFRGGS